MRASGHRGSYSSGGNVRLCLGSTSCAIRLWSYSQWRVVQVMADKNINREQQDRLWYLEYSIMTVYPEPQLKLHIALLLHHLEFQLFRPSQSTE